MLPDAGGAHAVMCRSCGPLEGTLRAAWGLLKVHAGIATVTSNSSMRYISESQLPSVLTCHCQTTEVDIKSSCNLQLCMMSSRANSRQVGRHFDTTCLQPVCRSW